MIWFTSDLHFGHRGVIDYCNRPFQSVAEMDAYLIKRWNAAVQPTDTVFVLGDLCFDKPSVGIPKVLELQGQKFLIKGNHDHWSRAQYQAAGFLNVLEEAVLDFAGKRCRLSHFPYRPTAEELEKMEGKVSEYRFFDGKRPPRVEGEFLIHGHCHTAWKQRENQINVGVDVWGFQPVSARVLESMIAKTKVGGE